MKSGGHNIAHSQAESSKSPACRTRNGCFSQNGQYHAVKVKRMESGMVSHAGLYKKLYLRLILFSSSFPLTNHYWAINSTFLQASRQATSANLLGHSHIQHSTRHKISTETRGLRSPGSQSMGAWGQQDPSYKPK